nr:hypothetical protein [Methylomarinum sp. Ch1-1]MDP4521472.1 hypothetical protein [Methylomarinum sp. Ch1-1]
MAVVRIQADCLAANPPYGCDANVALTSDVSNSVKRIKNRCASYRQHTLPHRRAASRNKPPKTAPGAKLAVVRIQADCLTANPPYGCDANVALTSDVSNSVKRIKNRCASYRQHTLPHRRAASRNKPPKTAPGAKLAVVRIQADCLAANPPYGRMR